MADFGIDVYTHELAQGLAANGVQTDVYTADASYLKVRDPRPNYRRFHVLGSRFPATLEDVTRRTAASPDLPLDESKIVLAQGVLSAAWKRRVRDAYLSGELALHLKRAKYDVVWTQWPDLGGYAKFWAASRLLRIPVVHTVHNILPHEPSAGDMAVCDTAYRTARLLFVHSRPVRDELAALFPAYASKAVSVPHGTYTWYKRCPEARARVRDALAIPSDAVVLLSCGLIRPYKNINACIEALAALDRTSVVLVIAGSDPDAPADDQLEKTRERVRTAGVEAQVRLIPGRPGDDELAELFEATDVLLLPYLKSYGSGLLMLGITFGKYVVATRTGMEESALRYPRAILLDGADTAEVLRGIDIAARRAAEDPTPLACVPPEFDWRNIAATCLDEIGGVVSTR